MQPEKTLAAVSAWNALLVVRDSRVPLYKPCKFAHLPLKLRFVVKFSLGMY